jgi:putative oxidoreductase
MIRALMNWLKSYSITLLRMALGVVFIWFGLLKIIDSSPVAHIISQTVYWWDAQVVVPAMGYAELLIGLGFFFSRLLPITFPIFLLQMAGTLLVLVIRPQITYQDGNVFLLTQEGEFIVKNLVLFTSGLIVFSHTKGK